MTVSEVIEVLQKYPQDTVVVALWDSGWSILDRHSIEKGRNGESVLVFDVEDYGTYEYQR